MIDLSTQYLGLNLKNPIIVGSSGLTDSIEKIQKIEKFGAGAVVLKSIPLSGGWQRIILKRFRNSGEN